MITYLINVSIAWMIFFVLYKALLEKEKYFKLNRIYLLSSLVLGLILPLISYLPTEEIATLPALTTQIGEVYQSQILAVEEFSSLNNSSIQTHSSSFGFNWLLVFQVIYFLGLSFALFRITKSFSKLYKLLVKSQVLKKSTHSEIIVSENILPFSFMKYVFIGDQDYNSGERNNILRHELYHVQSFHSIDVLFVEFLKIIFWWHPMIYLYKRAVAENHEYGADQAVLTQSSRKQYCELLMKATFPGVNLELTNPFFQTFIKKRITMMYQKESSRITLLKYPLALIAVVFMATIYVKPLIGQMNDPIKIASITGLEKYEKEDNKPIDMSTVVVTSNDVKLEEGKDFEMDKQTGQLTIINKEILKSGIPVNVKFEEEQKKGVEVNLPQNIESKQKPNSQQDGLSDKLQNRGDCKISEKGIYYKLDLTSRLTSCPEGEYGRGYSIPILSKFAVENFKWPAQAIEEGYQKFMVFNFVIDEKGKMAEILQMNEEPYPFGLEEEGHRIIDLMREEFTFLPGECDGKPVKSGMIFFLKVKIPEDKRHLVKVKDAKNVVPNQQSTINSASSEHGISISYYSNMNVAFSVEVENPDGKVVFTDSRDHLYSHYQEAVNLSEQKNGKYTLRVTQDGQVEETSMDVTVFK